jgi:acetyl-CoA carboxylase carboxyl transferase subunit beta
MSDDQPDLALSRFGIHQIFRHPDRIQADDVVGGLLHDVRYATDIAAEVLGIDGDEDFEKRMRRMGVIGGEGSFRTGGDKSKEVIFVGDLKPRGDDLESRAAVNYGVISPGGMKFKNRLYQVAEEQGKTLLLLPNTLGGEAGTNAARSGQSWLVSANIFSLLRLKTPIISIVLGEGGSGGALCGQIADRNLIMQFACYSTISPEQGAWILRGRRKRTEEPISDEELKEALDVLKPTAQDMIEAGIVDAIVPEFEGGCHLEKDNGYKITLENISNALQAALDEVDRGGASLSRKRIARALGYGRLQRYSSLRRIVRRIYDLSPISQEIPREKLSVPPQDEMFTLAYEQLRATLDTWGIRGDEGVRCEGRRFFPPLNDNLPSREERCGAILTEKEFQDNHKSCPRCGWGERLPHTDWLHALADAGSFSEFDSDLRYEDFEPTIYSTEAYIAALEKARAKSGLRSAAVTGYARINDLRVSIYLLDFGFMGGTLGIAEGEKFRRAADRARRDRIPLVGVFSSGGVRMAEGTLGLKQMEKTLAAVAKLEEARVPFYSVLVSPCTGGVISSNASAANHIIAERYGVFSFAGPGVVRSAGGEIEDYAMSPGIISLIDVPVGRRKGKRTIDKVVFRKDIKSALFDYIEQYYWLKEK